MNTSFRELKLISPAYPIFLAVILAGCSGGSSSASSSTAPTSCGTGTYNNGSGVCIADQYTVLVNPANTFWTCSFPYTQLKNYTNFYFATADYSSGTGTYGAATTQDNATSPPTVTPALASITWIPVGTNAVALSATSGTNLAPIYNLTNIVPNVNNTAFTANAYGNNPGSCTLTQGTITQPPPTWFVAIGR